MAYLCVDAKGREQIRLNIQGELWIQQLFRDSFTFLAVVFISLVIVNVVVVSSRVEFRR